MTRKLLPITILMILLLSFLGGLSRTHGAEGADSVRIIGSPPWQDWTHYHNYTEIVNTLLYLNAVNQSIVDVFSIGKSWENRTISCIRLTNESNTHPKPKLFFVGYHHAREPISAELALYFVVQAASGFGHNATITRMLNYAEIYVVVALNVDGFEAFKNNEWQRKNARPIDEDNDTRIDEDPPDDVNGNGFIEETYIWNDTYYEFLWWEGIDDDSDGLLNEDWVGGVDLNRNYGYAWNATVDSGSPDPAAEDYRGPEPFSEPETQAMRDFALEHNFKYAVSFHSGAEDILYPWGYTNEFSPDDQLFREISSNLSTLTGATYEQSGAWYTTSGVWDDWMYANRSAYAFTCEIYGNDSAWQYECLGNDTWRDWGISQAFNPDPEDIEPVVQRWLPVFTYLTDRAISEAYDVAITDVTAQQATVGQGQTTHVNVTVANQGTFNETFNVVLKANDTTIQMQATTLMDGDSATLVFDWDAAAFSVGDYTLSGYAVPLPGEADLLDNSYADGVVEVVILPPVVAVLSPENRTYDSHSVALDFTVDEAPSWMGYSLDGAASITLTGNTTLTGLADGPHYVVVYANNSAGIMGVSSEVHFAVDTIPPNITNVVQVPLPDVVWPDDEVKVNATVTDNSGHLKQVTLSFTVKNSSGAWFSEVNMTNINGNIWTATIPPFSYGSNVTYVITAEDEAGNAVTSEELGYECQYTVVPEIQPPLMLALLMTTTLLALAVRRKKNRQASF